MRHHTRPPNSILSFPWLHSVPGWFLGGVFLYSSLSKLRLPLEEVALSVEAYRLVSVQAAGGVARVLPWVEGLVGVALLIPRLRRWAGGVAAILFAGFITAIGSTFLRGIPLDSCGCFGAGVHLPPAVALGIDGVLLLLALGVARGGVRWGALWGRVFKSGALVCLIGLGGGGCARNPVSLKRETKLISENSEREIGRQTRDALIKEYGLLEDEVVSRGVREVGLKVASASDRPRLAYEFIVLNTPMVNAFAAPGGYIFVTRGLLGRLDNEAELAGILGHELGHVAAWHSVKMIEKQMGLGAVTTLGAIAAGVGLGPEAMIMVAQSAQLFSQLYILGYSRDYELEADRVGIRYALSAGYDPRAVLRFFEVLEGLEHQEGGDQWETYLRSHPPTGERIRLLKEALTRWDLSRRPLAVGKENLDVWRERLTPTLTQDLQVEGPRFWQRTEGVRLTLPEGWVWEPRRYQSLVSFREKEGGGWGELRRVELSTGQGETPVWKVLAQENQWAWLSGRRVLYPAGYGYLGQYTGAGVLGGLSQMRVLLVVRGSVVWVLICGSPQETFTQHLLAFEAITRGWVFDS